MVAIITRELGVAPKGSPLTNAEVDNNFLNIKTALDNLGSSSTLNVSASGDAAVGEVVKGGDSRLTNARPASDVYAWAKSAAKPVYTPAEVGAEAAITKSVGSLKWSGSAWTFDNTAYAAASQTFYLGTTQLAINRGSSALSLTGITSIDGSASKWSTARSLAGNSVDGSANVAFSNKFIVQGTADAGLSGAQFLGNLGTGLVKNTTTTGTLSIASPGVDYHSPGTVISVGDGGTGRASVPAGSLMQGNGTNALSLITLGAAGEYLYSDGNTWKAQALALEFAQAVLASDTSVSNNSGTDLLSVTLAKGTWLLLGQITCLAYNKEMSARIYLGTTILAASQSISMSSGSARTTISCTGVVTLTTTQTIKLKGISLSATGTAYAKTSSDDTKATTLVAVKIGS